MQLAFKIEDIRLLKADYSTMPPIVDKSQKGDEENSIEVNIGGANLYHQKEKRLEITINVTLKDKSSGYNLEVEYGAFFALDGKFEKEDIERISKINGPAILFPYVREYVSDLTRRAGHEPVYLPAINFIKSVENE